MTRRTRSSSAPPPSSSSSSSTKKFEVFEFNEEDERIEETSQRLTGKFTNPSKRCCSPITKYQFLKVFARGPKTLCKDKDISSDPIDLDAEVLCESEKEANCSLEEVRNEPLEVDSDHGGIDQQGTCADSCSVGMSLRDCADKEISGFAGFLESNFDLKNQSLDMVSDEDDSSQTSSSSTSTAEVEDSLEDQLMDHDSAAFEINVTRKVVDVFPDYIRYEDLYATRSRLIFSCSSLKLEGSTINETGGTFKFEWAIEDIIKIEACWCRKVETAMINIVLKSKDSKEGGNTNQNPGFKLLIFAVCDPCWCKAEEAIKLLDMRYRVIWNTIFDIDADNSENISALGLDSFFSRKHYFPIFDEAFDEIIYPKGEPDAVSISKRDVELLQPETFINDTIIDFYIKYLKNKTPHEDQNRFHFFNSFFFRKLADLDKDPSSATDGRAAFLRVRKWTRKVNLFEKDYILVPINYSLHWSLIVICHPGEVTCFKDEEIKESSKVPCILHMDSLKGSHKGLKNVFQSYLCEEWKERNSNVVDDVSSKFLHLRFVSLELPQQENFYDCGLFLLHYVERFLKEAPTNLNPFTITKFSNFLRSDWFPPPEASLKRSQIQNLIYDIFEDKVLKAPAADCIGKGSPSEIADIIKHRGEADSLGGSCYPSSSTTEETDIQFPAASPIRVASCLTEPGLVLKNLPGAVVNTPYSNCHQTSACHQRCFMSPIEETEEAEETSLSLEMEKSEVAILASDFPSTSYISKDYEASETLRRGLSVKLVEAVEGCSSSKTSTSTSVSWKSWTTLETGAPEGPCLDKIEESNFPDKTDALEHLSTSSEELADSVVQDSQEANDGGHDVSVKSPSFQGNTNSVTHQVFDFGQNTSADEDTSARKKESLASESDERDAKRPKLMHAGGEQRRFTRSMLKETPLMSS